MTDKLELKGLKIYICRVGDSLEVDGERLEMVEGTAIIRRRAIYLTEDTWRTLKGGGETVVDFKPVARPTPPKGSPFNFASVRNPSRR